MINDSNRYRPNQKHAKRRFNMQVNYTTKANRTVNKRGGIKL